MYTEFFSNSRFSFKPNKEDDLPQVTRLKHLLDMAGLIKKRSNKFLSLTKKGRKILNQKDTKSLFNLLIEPLFNKWNWGYSDAYSELMLIQSSVIFNIYLLHKKAQDWILYSDELGNFILSSALVNESQGYFCPEKEIIDCFETRFLNRVCLPLGLLEIRESEADSIKPDREYRISDFFKK